MLKRKIKIFIFIGIILSVLGGVSIVQAEDDQKDTYVKNGMVFVVGKHKPDERVELKEKVNKHIHPKKTITNNISDQDASDEQDTSNDENVIENINNEDSLEQIIEKDTIEEENLINILIGAIRGLWEKIISLGERMDKQDDNINDLVETTTSTTDELTNYNKRLEKLEDAVFEDNVDQPDSDKEK